jgi:hypothetical protein
MTVSRVRRAPSVGAPRIALWLGRHLHPSLRPRDLSVGSHIMNWAAAYDEGDDDMRSRRRHEKWLAALPCPCLRLDEPLAVDEQLLRLGGALPGRPRA